MVQTKKQRALISGAGIAGLTAAYWLVQIGWDVVVLEKASALREGEFAIDFAGTGWDVAIAMGLDNELKKRQLELNTLAFKTNKGVERSRIMMNDFIKLMGVSDKHVSINRRDLQNLLYEKVEANIDMRFSASIRSLEEKSNGKSVHVILEDGTEEEYELVIGADGLHSNVRKLAFGEEDLFAKYLGYYVSAFCVKGSFGNEPGVMNILRSPNKQAAILDLGDNNSLALLVFASKCEEFVPLEKRKQLLINKFGHMGGPIPSILGSIEDDTLIYMDTTTQIKMPKWHSKRVLLIGDAAYCLTLVSGQGASLAMGGAFFLAKSLESIPPDNIEQALIAYDARLRPFVNELQNKAENFASRFIPSSHFGLWLTDRMTSLVNVPIVKGFIEKQFTIKNLFDQD